MSLSVLTWNVEWATPHPRSRRTPVILRRIKRHAPEIVCLTETHADLLARDGHAICSEPDYGYPIKAGRRKVMLWSKEPWERVDHVGADTLPPGRFVSGVTRTSIGEVAVIGVCIPWSGSRTGARRGAARKQLWDDHAQYLDGLTGILKRSPARPLIVMGDFNQMIGPGSRAPEHLRSALLDAFPPDMRVATADLALEGRSSIDHIAVSRNLAIESLGIFSNIQAGKRLSDHSGVAAELSAQRA